MAKTFTITDRVRWSDVDRAGIIYYGRFQRFFEIAETELFREVGLPYPELSGRLKICLPRVQTHFNYRSPLRLDDLVEVSTWVGRFGKTSLTLNFEVYKENRVVVADGHIVLACVVDGEFRPRPLPEELKQGLAPYLAEAPPQTL